MASTTRQPVGEAATSWASALGLLSSKKTDEARKVGADVQARGNESGVKMVEACGALIVALAHLAKAAPQAGAELFSSLENLGATWSEAAGILMAGGSGGASGLWGKAGDLANTAADQTSKAGGDGAQALAKAVALAQEVGVAWTDKLTPVTVSELSSSPSRDEATLKAAAVVGAISDQKQKAAALVRAALAMLQMETPQTEEALKAAKEALAIFRELSSPEGEGTALRVVSMASLGQSAFESLQAANQALKTFKEIGHSKGQAAAIHSIAEAHVGKQSTDDALFKCGEALKLSRQIGDRMREVAVLETMVTANLLLMNGKKAYAAASDALAVAKSLGDQLLEARALCLLAKATGALGETAADDGIQAAKDALAIYQGLGLQSLEGDALVAMAAACSGRQDPTEALACGQRMADSFRQRGEKKEEGLTMCRIASIHLSNKEPDQALRAAQTALASLQAAGDRRGEADTLKLLAQIRLEKEEPGEALRVAEQACTLYRNQAFPTRQSRDSEIACIKAVVDSNAMMGGIDEAARVAGEAQRRFHGIKEKRGEGAALLMIAKLHLMRQETEDSMNALVKAPPLFLAVGDRQGEAEAWQQIAKIHLNKGEAGLAQRAAEECALAYRKLGDKKGRAGAAQLVADVHFALASVGAGSPQEALRAAQEAVSLYQDLGDKQRAAVSLHILANAQLMSQSFPDALKAAQDGEAAFKALRDPCGEAGSLLLAAGAHLGEGEFEECKRVAQEARDLFRQGGDNVGEDSVEDFLDNVASYEKGQLNRDDFRGFSMRSVESVQAGPAKGAQPRRERASRKPRQMSNIADIELIKADTSKDTKITLAFFEGFESRSAGGGSRPAPKAPEAAGGFSKGFQDGIDKFGAPQKEQVLYSVRWVQASAGRGAAAGPKKVGKREFAKEEDKRVVSSMQLGAPKENWGSGYGKTNRLFAAAGEQRGV
ncbi:unnamed protein product [Polarella glacialis]|uniref:Uncharacterized protein n=1 Tax=Polarella glacialis TaxID=89957 RepID=A0A813JKQ0_POLGL|nr:unnamed protein product [Polarella glacialis]